MTMLDERARRAAEGLKAAVAEAELQPFAGTAGGPVNRPVLASRALAFGGAFVLAMMLAGLAVVQMSIFAEDTATVADDPAPPTVIPDQAPTTVAPLTPPTNQSTQEKPPAPILPEPEEAQQEQATDTTPPSLTITWPADGTEVEASLVEFRGSTEPGAAVTRGRFEAEVDAEGNWRISLIVSSGSTKVTFTATDPVGNTSTAAVTVLFSPEAEPPEQPPKADVIDFTAYATYGSCLETPPYDVYYGTAEPGAKITISSKYGNGTTTADVEGNWEKKVKFPEAPYGKTFLVTVNDDAGNKKTFEFTSYAEG